jgi:hypothetical protein
MNQKLLYKNLALVDDYTPEYVLADWQQAITTFYNYYHQLLTCVGQPALKHEWPDSTRTHIGQCPVIQLRYLIASMQEALIKLIQDMDFVKQSPSISKKHKKLASHTQLLNDLSQQARNRLYLVNQSSS